MLLIMITIAAGVAYYVYSTKLLGSLEGSTQPGYENPEIEMITFSTNGSAQITVRNIGTGASSIVAIYVDGILKYSNPQGAVISPGQAQTFNLPSVPATQHSFSVRTLDGGGVGVYGPDVIYFAVTVTGSTTMTTVSTTYTSIYTSTLTTATSTIYSTQVTTTSTSTSQTTLATTSTQGLSTTSSTTTYLTTTSTSYYKTTTHATTTTSSTHYYTSTVTSTTYSTTTSLTTLYTTSGITTSFFTTATGTTPTTTISGPVTTTVTSTVTTMHEQPAGLSSLLLISLIVIVPWSAIRSKLVGKTSLPRRQSATTTDKV